MLTCFCWRRIFFPLLVLQLLGAAAALASGSISLQLVSQDATGVEAEVTSAYEGVPNSGFMPLHVHIKNPSQRQRSCRVSALIKSNGYGGGSLKANTSFEVSCPPGSEVKRDLLVPVPPTLHDAYNRTGTIWANMSGAAQNANHYDSRQATPQWPAIAISKALANRNLEQLKKRAEKRNAMARQFGVVVRGEKLPGDWRALAGFDVVLLTSPEWAALNARQRSALRDWVQLGGTLDMYASPGSATLGELGFLAQDKSASRELLEIGLGRVRLHALKDETVNPDGVCQSVTRTVVRNRGKELTTDFKKSWSLVEELPLRTFHSPVWICLLIGFGILMGPVNLFLLAGKQRRHRLFFTTPLIALVSSLLLGLCIFFIDGTGGRGHRFTVVELQPEKGGRKAYVTQQSLLATGLLTGSSFVEQHPTVHFPAALAKSRWARITGRRGESARFDVSEQGVFRGDWLSSRSRHGYVSQAVVPSRARFELAGTRGEPALVSGLGFATDKVFYLAGDGDVWCSSAQRVATGQRVTLQRSNMTELGAWRKKVIERASEGLRRDLRELPLRPGYFYAVAAETGMEHSFGDSIRWEKSSAFLFGPVVVGGEEKSEAEKREG